MRNALSGKPAGIAVSCALTLGAIAAMGNAVAATNPEDNALLIDGRGLVVKSGYGLCWHTGFGPKPPSTAECDPNYRAPAQIAAVAPPPVAVAAVSQQPVSERVTFDSDALFDFDKAVLRPAGRDALDQFVDKIKDVTWDAITVVGHTDRLGSDAYNQALSERRAEAVKSYLAGKGLAADRIGAVGKGEAQPVSKPEECTGPKSAKVIACLQPDRRVEVEVVGSRMVTR